MIRWFPSWLRLTRKRTLYSVSLFRLKRRLSALSKEKRRTAHRLRRRGRQIARLRGSLDELGDRTLREAEAVDRAATRYEHEIDKLRNQIEILEEVVVPGLTEANRRFHEMWRAEVAVQVKHQAVTVSNPEE